jgi:hypothetical protein
MHVIFEPQIPECDFTSTLKRGATQGIETSQYLQENKLIRMPLVRATEHGKGQTESVLVRE